MKQCLVFVFVLAALGAAVGDGGRVRLHQKAGPFTVTLFTTPDPLTAGAADFSVAVERDGVPGLIENAAITLVLTPVGRPGQPLVLHASHAAATNRLLQAANFNLPSAGVWRVDVVVQQASGTGRCSTNIQVHPAALARNKLAWDLAPVPLVACLFVIHQWRKRSYARLVHRRAQQSIS
jgi:hypothetical protein